MTTSNEGLNLIKKFEGLRLKAYKCPAGVWTIGYGTTHGVTQGMEINEAMAVKMLKRDVSDIERYLNMMGINFMQRQFDALVSWMYNLGTGNFARSTLRKRILTGASDELITDEIVKWVNSGGKPLSGLKKRRVAEANMFLGRERYKIKGDKIVKI